MDRVPLKGSFRSVQVPATQKALYKDASHIYVYGLYSRKGKAHSNCNIGGSSGGALRERGWIQKESRQEIKKRVVAD